MARLPALTPHVSVAEGTPPELSPSSYKTPGRILWQWNEKDLTQFGTAVDDTIAGSISVSVVSGNLGNRIQYDLSGFQGFYLMPLAGIRVGRRFAFHARFHEKTSGGSNDNAVLVHTTNLASGLASGSVYGILTSIDHNGAHDPLEAGSRSFIAATADVSSSYNSDNGIITRGLVAMGDIDPNSGDPDYSIHLERWHESANVQDSFASVLGSHSWAAGWDGLVLDRLGFGISTAGSGITGTYEISELAILQHPVPV